MLYSVHKMEHSRREADLYIRPPVDDVGLLEFEGLEKLAEIGYRHASPIAEKWRRELKDISIFKKLA